MDEILGADQAAMLAYVTPAKGVVLAPVTNFAMRDRERGTITVNSSLGAWRKLDRIRRNPNVALAFHTRAHGFSERPEYILAQGEASLSPFSDRRWIDSHREAWERFAGEPARLGPIWERWLAAYHWRVGIEVAIKRILVWADLDCRGEREVFGAPLPPEPLPQRPPRGGISPRMRPGRVAGRARRLPDALLGWVGGDGLPLAVPVAVGEASESGIALTAPPATLPPGARRAGLTAHRFTRHVVGQEQRVHTGWLEADPGEDRALYAPHTESGYRMPASRLVYRIAVGFETRRRLRGARRAGMI